MKDKLPLNRIVAFLGPYISTGSGVVAAWLLVHVHFLSLFHLDGDKLGQGIAQLVTFAIVTLVTWLGHQKWLDGWIAWETGSAPRGTTVTNTVHLAETGEEVDYEELPEEERARHEQRDLHEADGELTP